MKAFIAILLVAAVSGTHFTGGLNKSLWDLIRSRNAYGTYGDRTAFSTFGDRTAYPFGTYGDRTVYPFGDQTTYATYGKYLEQVIKGLTSGSDYTTGESFPFGGYNVPSDVYQSQGYTYMTLSQLYASPIFQQYLSLPLFRQYVTYPAFQRYLVSGYFQQYYTQSVFQQFFREPALFYRYIFPVLAQFQTVGTYEPVISVPEVYRQYVPEYVYNYINNYVKNGAVDTTVVGGKGYFPTPYGGFGSYGKYNTAFNKYFGGFNFEKFANNYPYNYNFEGYSNGLNYNDFETIRKVLYSQVFDKTYKNLWGNKMEQGMKWENILGNKKEGLNMNWENTATYTPTWALDKIVKDLVEGKVDINEQIKNVVNPITGEVKLVDEKIVKPFDTTFDGEFTKDALNKVMLKKEVFNKL